MGRRIESAVEKKTGSCSLCKDGRNAGNADGADKKAISTLEGKSELTTEKELKALVGLETIQTTWLTETRAMAAVPL